MTTNRDAVHLCSFPFSLSAWKHLPSRDNFRVDCNRTKTGTSSILIIYEGKTFVAAGVFHDRALVGSASIGIVGRLD